MRRISSVSWIMAMTFISDPHLGQAIGSTAARALRKSFSARFSGIRNDYCYTAERMRRYLNQVEKHSAVWLTGRTAIRLRWSTGRTSCSGNLMSTSVSPEAVTSSTPSGSHTPTTAPISSQPIIAGATDAKKTRKRPHNRAFIGPSMDLSFTEVAPTREDSAPGRYRGRARFVDFRLLSRRCSTYLQKICQ